MQQSQYLTVKTQLNVSPRMQQAVRLLQMSALEFTDELQQAVASNPFLEEQEAEARAGEPDAGQPAAEAGPLPEPLPDWSGVRSAPRDGDAHDLADWASEPPELRDHLRAQLHASRLSPRATLAAEIVIDTLDDDGWLRQEPLEAATQFDVEPPLSADEIAGGIQTVRGFEPAGVGARDLADCLRLQLAASDAAPALRELASELVRHHLERLARHDDAALAEQLGCSAADVQAARELIQTLDPHPGTSLAPSPTDHVIPDVLVLRQGERLTAVVNPALLPKLKLNQLYVDLFRRARDGNHGMLAQQLQEARWLLRNAQQRFVTIKRVADVIVARQRAFFVYGDVALKPLVLREVAEELGLHESTISRATAHKYMATPRGLYPFKHFFSAQLQTRTGGICSATAVQALIREMIAQEPPRTPLSDVDLAQRLGEQGIRVARRTVTKYRTQMKLLPAELRQRA